MQDAQREPPGNCGEVIGEHDRRRDPRRDDDHELRPEASDEPRHDEAGKQDAERRHRRVVADHLRRDAFPLHEQRQQREHQSEREAEHDDRGDRRGKIDEALTKHATELLISTPPVIASADKQDRIRHRDRDREGADPEGIDCSTRERRSDNAADPPHHRECRRACDEIGAFEIIAHDGERHRVDREIGRAEDQHHRPDQPARRRRSRATRRGSS